MSYDAMTAHFIYGQEAEHRQRMEKAGYITPPKTDNAVFTGKELFEFIDEQWLRDGIYQRNNQRTLDPEMELGDAIKMAATGWLTSENDTDDSVLGDRSRILIHQAIADLGHLLWSNGASRRDYWHLMMLDLLSLAEHCGYDPYQAYRRSCEKIERKHGGVANE